MDNNKKIVVEAKIQDPVVESLHSLILENLEKIHKLKEDKKNLKEMENSILGEDDTYKSHAETAANWNKTLSATKKEILKRPVAASNHAKIEEISEEIEEINESMSSYMAEYERLAGTNEIEDKKGNYYRMVKRYKITRAQNKLFD